MIPVSEPLIDKNSFRYVNNCLKTGWISSTGKYIDLFEKEFADYLGAAYATTTTNGTTALHLAFAALGLGKGDEVLMPDLTIISCALAAIYVGATPVFVDVDKTTCTIDPDKIEEKITPRTKAILVVHLYGYAANMDRITRIAKKYGLLVIEDVAEAIGCEYNGKKLGMFSDVSCFSFYANKLITTGEGGMVVTNNKGIFEKCRSLKNLAHSKRRRFLHEQIGFNHRMTNIQAAIGLAQLENINTHIKKKGSIARRYSIGLQGISDLVLPAEPQNTKYICWMYTLILKKESDQKKDTVLELLKKRGIETREFFIPLHRQPIIKKMNISSSNHYPVSDYLSTHGFYIPSGLTLTKKQINFVINALQDIFSKKTS